MDDEVRRRRLHRAPVSPPGRSGNALLRNDRLRHTHGPSGHCPGSRSDDPGSIADRLAGRLPAGAPSLRTKAPTSPDEAPPPPAGRSPALRVTALGMFAGGFLLLLGAVAAVLAAQIMAKPLAAWLSMGFSAGALICTVTAVVIGRRR